jgi:DNA-binding transcriptional ArsR family regulator
MKSTREKPAGSSRKRLRSAATGASRVGRSRPEAVTSPADNSGWTFLTNHAHVLLLLPRNPSLVLREIAMQVGITERAVQRIIADLEAGGIIDREKVGRQNRYRIRADLPLRHPIESHRTVGQLLALINGENGR